MKKMMTLLHMPGQQSLPENLESFISTEFMPKLIELYRFEVLQLNVDLTGMNIRLRLQLREAREPTLLTWKAEITDPPDPE